MLEMGKAMMGTGEAEGEDRAIKAAELAISNPLLDDTSIANAKGVIINISGGEDVKLYEIDEIAAHIKKQCKEDVNLIVGNTIENIEDGKIRVSLLASGISSQEEEGIRNTENKFVKPRLVSNTENKNIKINSSMQTETKQADLEDFLSKEINDALQENSNKVSSDKKINDNDFFIPKEEVTPNKEKTLTTNPFKEADLLNASGSNTNSNDESISLISRLSSNVKEKAINVGSKAISMVSEVANKSLENKFMKKDEMEDIKSNEFNSKERVEPSFMGLENNEENKLNAIDNTTMQDTNYNNIPSFLKRNRD
jgi:DNA-binding protein